MSVTEVNPPPMLAPMVLDDPRIDEDAISTTTIDIESGWPAWLCVAGAFCFLMPSYGMMQSIGTFQTYLSLHQLHTSSVGDVGWITGMYMFLGLACTIQVGPLMDHYGPRVLSPVAAGLSIVTFLLLAECRAYWHFMLCLGVLGGLASAVAAPIAVGVVGKLFVRRRGLAMGVALAGSSVGSVVIPLLLRGLFPRLGWPWSMRVLALVVAALMIPGVGCFWPFPQLLRETLPGGRPVPRTDRALLNFSAFKIPAFSFVTAGLFVLEFAIVGLGAMLPTVALDAGLTAEDGYALIAILGGCGTVGRIVPGLIGDKIGHFNVLLTAIFLGLVFTATMFVPFTTTGSVLYAFSALWGFASGSFLSISPVCMGKTCDPKDYGRFYGTMNFVISFSLLLSIPLTGIMVENMGSQALAGLLLAVVFLGEIFLFAARALLIGQWFTPMNV